MKHFLIFLLIGISIPIMAQRVDTVIITDIYKSYFDLKLKSPLFVVYNLYKGGGDCSRKSMEFEDFIFTESKKDYAHSGYDIGHMANAEDFAFDCNKMKNTFKQFNALPQTSKLNRSCWKSLETRIRQYSQKDSILIICGGFNFTKIQNLNVPTYCFKIFKNLRTNQVNCYLFKNDNSDMSDIVNFESLLKEFDYNEKTKEIIRELLIIGKK